MAVLVKTVDEPVDSSRIPISVVEVSERYCPECGQPLALNWPAARTWPPVRLWPSWALLAIGLLLIAGSGIHAAAANQAMADSSDGLRRATGMNAGDAIIARPLDPDRVALVQQDDTLWLLSHFAAAQQQRDRDLRVLGIGLLILVMGLASPAREQAQRRVAGSGKSSDQRSARPLWRAGLALLLGAWALGEIMLVIGLDLIAVGLGVVVFAQVTSIPLPPLMLVHEILGRIFEWFGPYR